MNKLPEAGSGPRVNSLVRRLKVQGDTAQDVASDVAHTEFGVGEMALAFGVRIAVRGGKPERRPAQTSITVKLRTIEGQDYEQNRWNADKEPLPVCDWPNPEDNQDDRGKQNEGSAFGQKRKANGGAGEQCIRPGGR